MPAQSPQTFRGSTMDEALLRVREALGEDALVLRTFVDGRGGHRVEAVAATGTDGVGHAPLVEIKPLRYVPAAAEPPQRDALEVMRSEIAALRRAVEGLQLRRQWSMPVTTPTDLGPEAALAFTRLTHHGVLPWLADQVLRAAVKRGGEIGAAVLAELAQRMPARDLLAREQPGRLVIVLVGPTGAGKTSTIARLAAALRHQRGALVGLIAADARRLGSVEALQGYARVIGVPVRVAIDAGEVVHALASLPEDAVILIDTPGCSPNDAGELEQIGSIVGAAGPAEPVLVLPMSGDTGSMLSVREAFAGVCPSALVLTKLDEAPAPGAVLNMVAAAGLDVWCVTDGRGVPGSLTWADAAQLAAAVWEGRVRP